MIRTASRSYASVPYHGGIAVRRTFANLDGPQNTKGLPDVLRWKLGLHDQTQPRTPSTGVEIPVLANDGRALRAATRDALTWIGHASFLVQLGGLREIWERDGLPNARRSIPAIGQTVWLGD